MSDKKTVASAISPEQEPSEPIIKKRCGRKKGQRLELLGLSDGGYSGRRYVAWKDLGLAWNFCGIIKETPDEPSGDSDYSASSSDYSENEDDIGGWTRKIISMFQIWWATVFSL